MTKEVILTIIMLIKCFILGKYVRQGFNEIARAYFYPLELRIWGEEHD